MLIKKEKKILCLKTIPAYNYPLKKSKMYLSDSALIKISQFLESSKPTSKGIWFTNKKELEGDACMIFRKKKQLQRKFKVVKTYFWNSILYSVTTKIIEYIKSTYFYYREVF